MPSIPLDFEDLPDPALAPELRAFVTEGRLPGTFLLALVCNDLRGAVAAADELNRARLSDWVTYCEEHLPIASWGSPVIVGRWCSTQPVAPQRFQRSAA